MRKYKRLAIIVTISVICFSFCSCSGFIDMITGTNPYPSPTQIQSEPSLFPYVSPTPKVIDDTPIYNTNTPIFIDFDVITSLLNNSDVKNSGDIDSINARKVREYLFNRTFLADYKSDRSLSSLFVEMYISIVTFQKTYTINSNLKVTKNQLRDLYTLLTSSSPELFNVQHNYTYYIPSDSHYVSKIDFSYILERDEYISALDKLKNTIDYMIGKTKEFTDIEKELFVHDYILDKCEYTKNGRNISNAYGALINGKALCEGYSDAFTLVMYSMGIETAQVHGESKDSSTSQIESHAWNIVKLDGEWYNIDLTWNDFSPSNDDFKIHGSLYAYFNITDEDINKNHFLNDLFADRKQQIAKCTSTTYNYYNMFGHCVNNTTEDPKAFLLDAIKTACEGADSLATVFIKFPSSDYYDDYISKISDAAFEYNKQYASSYNIESFVYTYDNCMLVVRCEFVLKAK